MYVGLCCLLSPSSPSIMCGVVVTLLLPLPSAPSKMCVVIMTVLPSLSWCTQHIVLGCSLCVSPSPPVHPSQCRPFHTASFQPGASSTRGELHSRPGLKFNFSTPRSTQRRFTLGSREPTFISTRGEFNPEFGTNDSHCSRRNPGRVFCRCCTCALTNDKSQNAMHLHRNT